LDGRGILPAAVVGLLALTVARGSGSDVAQRIEMLGGSGSERGVGGPYELTRLVVFNRVLFHVTYEYVDPRRVQPPRMLLGALNAIEQFVPEVMVEELDPGKVVEVRVGAASERFRLDDVDSPWRLAARMFAVMRFLDGKLVSQAIVEKPQDVEYAAVNGMLRTLDPHTILMTPEANREMRMATQGEFGGIGINIGLRDGNLTVISPIRDTPAWREGLKSDDHIVQIGDESTVNMPLDEAVSKLRGLRGTQVVIWIERRGWTEPRRFEITRATIPIQSVKWTMLEDGVGYAQVIQFHRNTVPDLQSALDQLRRDGMRRLVIDLRDDPGGVLEASIQLSDMFLRSGTILTTAGNDPRENAVENASSGGTEPDYPIAVLVNGGSASASEIVAGALKNTGRAVLVGSRTFGKGSVQAIHEFDDESALKITIAQYLTPGDISIQSVGIVPDIETVPMHFRPEMMDVFDTETRLNEAGLQSHLSNDRAAREQKSTFTVRYFLDAREEEEPGDAPAADPDAPEPEPEGPVLQPNREPFESDFEVELARRIVVGSSDANRRRILAEVGPLVEAAQREEDRKLRDAFAGIGIDWNDGPAPAGPPPRLSIRLNDGAAPEPLQPGASAQMVLRVRNEGSAPLYRLHAVTQSDNRLFADREFLFGRLDPGAEREWRVEVKAPAHAIPRVDPVRFLVRAAGEPDLPPHEVRWPIADAGRPVFAYRLSVNDGTGNGDGRVQPGESFRFAIDVVNRGARAALEPVASIRNKSGESVFIRRGRVRLDEIPAAGSAGGTFEIELRAGHAEPYFVLELTIADFKTAGFAVERIRIPVARPPAEAPVPDAAVVAVAAGSALLETPDPDAPVVGTFPQDVRVPATHRLGDRTRVQLPDGHAGWLPAAAVGRRGGIPSDPIPFVALPANTQPVFENVAVEHVVRADHGILRGAVRDDDPILDLQAFVGDDKVFYADHRGAADPSRMAFEIPLPVGPGANRVRILARERSEVGTWYEFYIRRDAPDGSTLETAEPEDEFEDW
jgi:carboxyl-terminal processing protease